MIVIAIWVSYSLTKLVTIERTALVERHTGFKTSNLLAEICYQAFGKWGCYILEATVSLTMLGVGVVYITTSADLISHLPWDKAGSDFLYTNKAMFVLFIGILLIPLVLLRDCASLSFASMLGNVAIIGSLIIVFVYGLVNNDFSHMHDIPYVHTSVSALSNLFGTLIFSYGIIFNLMPVLQDMRDKKQFPLAMNGSLGTAATLYIIVTISLCVIYNNVPSGIAGNIIQNLDSHNPCYYVSTILVSLMCIFSFPLAVCPAVQILEPKPRDDDCGFFTKTPGRILLRVVVLIIDCGLGALIPSFNIAVTLIGDITLTFGTFILPPVLYLKMKGHEMTKFQIGVEIFFIILGVATMIFATVNSILSL